MKKIIKNRVYDTETARPLASWSNGRSLSDFSYLSESLYQKRNGEFFLHGRGGASTPYAVQVDTRTSRGGERIMPLSYDAARAWAEEKLPADEYEAIFGAVSEDDDTRVTTSISISASSFDRLKRLAQQSGMSVSAYIESIIPDTL